LLECEVLSNRIVWGSSDWKAVPDIWRTAAEKYANQTAIVDPYHDPPLRLTYKQVTSLPHSIKSRHIPFNSVCLLWLFEHSDA